MDHVHFSDEAHFLLNGQVNSKNNVVWESPFHSEKVTVCASISKHGIIGPFFFEDDAGHAVTVNKERYIAVLRKFWQALGRRRGVQRDEQWFQQDGAPPHTANITMEWLRGHFGDRLISRKAAITWASHSPDMTPLTFTFGGI